MKKVPFPLLFMTFLRFVVHSYVLTSAALALCAVGIYRREFLYAGVAVLTLDVMIALFKTVIMKRAIENGEGEDFKPWADIITGADSAGFESDGIDGKPEENKAGGGNPDPDAEALRRAIGESMTVEEIVSEFEKICAQISGDDLVFLETGTFAFTGEKMFYFSLTRQTAGERGFRQLHVDLLYEPDRKNRFLRSALFSDRVRGDFFGAVRRTKAYRYASDNRYSSIRIYSDDTD